MIFSTKNKIGEKENELLTGINYVNSQISQYESMIFNLERLKKDFISNRERMQKELSDIKENRKKIPIK